MTKKDPFEKIAKDLKLPAGTRRVRKSFSWEKRGGFSGANTVRSIIERAKALGFTPMQSATSASADGMVASYSDQFTLDEWTLYTTVRYGATQAGNRFSITLIDNRRESPPKT